MTAKELFKYLTEDAGLDDATAQVIAKAADNEKVQAKAKLLKDQKEYESLVKELDGDGPRIGTRAYAAWYAENYPKIQEAFTKKAEVETTLARYQERFGALDATTPPAPTPAPAGKQVDEETIAKLVDQRIQTQYGGQWSNLLKGSGKLIEKHLRAKRDKEIDWDAISEIAAKKGNDLNAAYDEWDAPEREKSRVAAEDARVEARVKQEVEKRLIAETRKTFPTGTESTSTSPLFRPPSTSSDGKPAVYDRSKVIEAAMTGEYEGFGKKDTVFQ